jgi:phosphate transport system permease protein
VTDAAIPVRPTRRPVSATGTGALARRVISGDSVAAFVVRAAALAVVVVTVALAYSLWVNSSIARHRFGWHFFVTQSWNPVTGEFGALPFIYGTVVTSFIALLVAIPAGVGAAIFLSELAPRRLSDAMTFLIELLAAVPSVIYGLIGMFLLVPAIKEYGGPLLRGALGWTPFFQGPFYGVSFLSAGIVLAVMILPFIVSVSRQVLIAVPQDQREGALALGATKWEMTWKVVVPFARQGIYGSIFLALARALGETMAVTMVIGNDPKIHASLFAPGYSIAAVIANEFTEATDDLYIHSLIYLGLVLFALTIVINGVARLLIHATSRNSATHA